VIVIRDLVCGGEWSKVHKEEPHDLYSSPTIVQVIKLRRMRWAGHVGWMRGRERETCIVGLKRDGPCAEARFRVSEKRTSPFESAGVSA
jgi:hypothetical protein